MFVTLYILCCAGPDCAVRTDVELPVNDDERLCSIGSLQGIIQFGTSSVDLLAGLSDVHLFSLGGLTAYIDTTSCNGFQTCIPTLLLSYNDIWVKTMVLNSFEIATFASSPYDVDSSVPLTTGPLVTETGCVLTVEVQSQQL